MTVGASLSDWRVVSSQLGVSDSADPIRLAILEADTPNPQTVAKYGSYGGVFTSLFTRAVAPADLSRALSLTYYSVVSNPKSEPVAPFFPALESIDAILITGSKHNAFDDAPWIIALTEYVRQAMEGGKVKVIGVCFGHQIVGRALGVPVERSDKGWEVSVTEIKLSEKGREIFGPEKDTLVSLVSLVLHSRERSLANQLA
jgi:GMP synthase (glutamine-hydrolysing)